MRVITGKARGVVLKTPEGMQTRPTTDRVKEALFSIIQFEVPAARVLDLFGGTGQLGIEALSRDANYAVFVDEREDACRLIRENLKRTKLEGSAKVKLKPNTTYYLWIFPAVASQCFYASGYSDPSPSMEVEVSVPML